MYIHNEDYVINELTGEVLRYETRSYQPDTSTLNNDRHYTLARDVEELNDIVKHYKEKRYGDVSYFLDKERLGKWYIPVLKLCSKISYFNVGFYDRKDVADIFGIKETSINKTLNKLVDIKLLTYTGKGLSKGCQIRITWNPLSVWKGWSDSPTRSVAIQSWYKGYFNPALPNSDLYISTPSTPPLSLQEDKPIASPDPYVSKWFNMMPKDRFDYLMSLSDVEFELYLLEILANNLSD